MTDDRTATLYRMVLPDHECPFGVHAKELLEHSDYEFDEHILATRDEVEAFKTEHSVDTTPQVFIAGKRIGGSSDLKHFLEEESSKAS